MGDETEHAPFFKELFFFGLWSNPSSVVPGVLQQPRRDVVPQGDDTVLTLRALSPAVTISQSNPLPGVQWEGSRESRQMRANRSSPSSEGGRLENKDVSRLLCSEHEAFLVSTEAFLFFLGRGLMPLIKKKQRRNRLWVKPFSPVNTGFPLIL